MVMNIVRGLSNLLSTICKCKFGRIFIVIEFSLSYSFSNQDEILTANLIFYMEIFLQTQNGEGKMKVTLIHQ